MKSGRRAIPCCYVHAALALLAVASFAGPARSQTAPQRSDELCSTLQKSASEKGRKFTVTRPGACRMNIDAGYNFFVDYDEQALHLGLHVDPVILNGDASAFWLRLSAFDNLAYSALGTKQRAVFDEMNRMAKKLAQEQLKRGLHDKWERSNTDKAILGAGASKDAHIVFMASAFVKDIDKMKRKRASETSGEIPRWRKILALSLEAFAAGAKSSAAAYESAYQNTQPRPLLRSMQTCYTSFIGDTILTNCY